MAAGNIVFYTPERMAELWKNVESLLSMVSPGVMIWVAITAVGMLLIIIINAFRQATAPKEEDDDDVEVRHY